MEPKYKVGDILYYKIFDYPADLLRITEVSSTHYSYEATGLTNNEKCNRTMSIIEFEKPQSDEEILRLLTPLEKAML